MRFIRFIFGRFFVVFLLAVVQVVSFVALFVFLQQILPYYFFVNTAFTVAAILIVVHLINRGQNPDYIIPWIIVVLIMPLSGVVVYLMLQGHISKRQKRLYQRINEGIFPFVQQNEDAKQRLLAQDKFMHGQSQYLLQSCSLPLYDNTQVQYLPSGEEFFQSLKQEIKNAERFILLEFFIVERGVMFDAILELLMHKLEEGVEVRLMYDDIGSIATVGMSFYKKMRKLGIKCVKFNRFLPLASAVHNNRDHRKIVVVDGKTAFVTGANLADEYINSKKQKGQWKDSAVLLRGGAAKSLMALFLSGFNAQTKTIEDCSSFFAAADLAQQEQTKKGLPTEWGFVQPFGDGPSPLYEEKVSQNALLNLINQSQSYVYITTPYLIVDFQLTQAMQQAARRGVDIRIVTPKIPDKRLIFLMTRSAYPNLIKAGVKIYEYTPGFMHSKMILSDGKAAIVGTINLDYRSLVHHFECGVWMYGVPALGQIADDFASIFALSEQITYEKSKQKLWQRLLKSVLQLFAPLL